MSNLQIAIGIFRSHVLVRGEIKNARRMGFSPCVSYTQMGIECTYEMLMYKFYKIRKIGTLIRVSHTACKDEFRQNLPSHSWSVFLSYVSRAEWRLEILREKAVQSAEESMIRS